MGREGLSRRLTRARIGAGVIAALVLVAAASAGVTYYITVTTGRHGMPTHTPPPSSIKEGWPGRTRASVTTSVVASHAWRAGSNATSAGTQTQVWGGEAKSSPAPIANASTTAATATATHAAIAAGNGVARLNDYASLLKLLSTEESMAGQAFTQVRGPLIMPYLGGAVPQPATVTVTPTTTLVQAREGVEVTPPPHSTTNVQVQGVGEADIVKNDGIYLYIVSVPRFARIGKHEVFETPVYIVKAYPPSGMRVVGKVVVEGIVKGIYVKDGELIVINQSLKPWPAPLVRVVPGRNAPPLIIMRIWSPRTGVLAFNISDRASPKLMWIHSLSGYYLTSRFIGSVAYVLTVQPALMPRVNGSRALYLPAVDGKALPPENVSIVATNPLQPWLNSFVTVACIEIGSGRVSVESYVMPAPQRVYVSRDSIYLLSSEWLFMNLTLDLLRKAILPVLPGNVSAVVAGILANSSKPVALRVSEGLRVITNYLRKVSRAELGRMLGDIYSHMIKVVLMRPVTATLIYRLALHGTAAELAAKGMVFGRVLDQFAMREERGYFILATTSTVFVNLRFATQGWLGMPVLTPVMGLMNSIYVLNATTLKPVGRLTGVARGERVFSARFVGNYLFLVTYRSIDPLFAINLTDPRSPKVIGYVKVPGFSRYLHPYGDRYLIGVGYMTRGNRIVGIKVSMYDVGNPRNIKEVSQVVIRASWAYTNVAWNYKAFLINPRQGYIAIPVALMNWTVKGGRVRAGAYLYVIKVGSGYLRLLGRISEAGVVRAAYIGNYIYAISRTEVKAAIMPTLKVIASVRLT